MGNATLAGMLIAAAAGIAVAPAAGAAERVVPLDLMKHMPREKSVNLKSIGEGVYEWYIPKGGQNITIDLAALGVDPVEYDEIRFDIKPLVSQVGMWMRLKGHLEPGQVSRWYLKFKTSTGQWSEGRYETRLDDDGVYARRGDTNDTAKTLEIALYKRVLGYPGEPEWRRAHIRNVRLVKHVVSAEFRLLETEIEQDGAEVAYTYKLHLRNRTDLPQAVSIDLDSAKTLHYFRVTGPDLLVLGAEEHRVVPVRISLPMMKALALPPLYAEPLYPKVYVAGVPDSDVIPLRGYRRFPMWAAVPVFNRVTWDPITFQAFVAARSKILPGIDMLKKRTIGAAEFALKHRWPVPDFGPPRHDQGYRCRKCKCWFKPFTPTALHKHQCPKCKRIEENNDKLDRAWLVRYNSGNASRIRSLAVAWLFTGQQEYAEKAKEILLDYAAGYAKMPVTGTRTTAAGSRLGANTLHSSYVTPRLAEGYHYLRGAPCLDEGSRAKIVAFLKQAGVEVVQHSVEYGNQQIEHLRAYGSVGLVTEFWPLTAEAIHGEFGYHEVVEYGFSEDGIAHEGGAYHHAAFSALNEFGLFAYEAGLTLFTPRLKRVFDGSIAAGLARTTYELAYRIYRDPSYIPLIARKGRGSSLDSALLGVLGVPDVADLPVRSVHMAGAGYVFLKRGNAASNTEIRLNYIKQFDRSERDRLTTFFYRNGRQVDGTVGRITYGSPHCKWMESTAAHNCIVIDGADAKAYPSKLIAFDPSPEAPIAAVMTEEATPLYEGVSQLRCFALIEGGYVVFDRVVCARPRTIDRYQWGRGKATTRTKVAGSGGQPEHVPKGGSFSNVGGGRCGPELRVDFANGLKMRLISDGELEAYTAVSVGGYQAKPMEVTFARRSNVSRATFLGTFSYGKDAEPPVAKILRSGDDEVAFEVRTKAGAYVVTVAPAKTSVSVVKQ